MSTLQAIVLAIIQGITEVFPVSSLGHAVIVPDLLDWQAPPKDRWLPFLVTMRLGTATATFLYFWRDWRDFAKAVLLNRGPRAVENRRLFWRVVVATMPATIVGAAFEKPLGRLFSSSELAAFFLMVEGAILFAAERLKRPVGRFTDQLTWMNAVSIGLWQCLALVPGLSRSGTSMVGGLRAGLDHKDAARFSFLTGAPIIFATGLLQAPKLLGADRSVFDLAVVAGVVAAIAAYVSVCALMRWLRTHALKALDPFAFYCGAAGALSLSYLVLLT
jgi:undecaprenyl-diphosphatase